MWRHHLTFKKLFHAFLKFKMSTKILLLINIDCTVRLCKIFLRGVKGPRGKGLGHKSIVLFTEYLTWIWGSPVDTFWMHKRAISDSWKFLCVHRAKTLFYIVSPENSFFEDVLLQAGIRLFQFPSLQAMLELPSMAQSWPRGPSQRKSTFAPLGNKVLSRN